ncbi:hypothetical protein KFV02_00305 [Desulfohalobiaceae bacterium Ax17]|uniref:hypothetical protein n=1 Tax=Desulfovulcanus ferrireducens TaxID=2831190 RepID=UPI00207BB8D9|nr:hypothetical protein [Desulfovulcanus ferrireducens]MBT8762374.1 hypothetical protein [Desulfovulcanus ferrireducens]
MQEEFSLLIDESIQLEHNIAKLYTIFHATFPEDADFWWQLVLEEKNHAALIRAGKESFAPIGKFPVELLSSSLQKLRDANKKAVALARKCLDTPPSREEAFNIALEFEQSAGEIHFQRFMEKKTDVQLIKIFQKLNKDDKNHATRLRSYMEKHGIRIRKPNDDAFRR